jgi:outer membrane protein assembly factor BamD
MMIKRISTYFSLAILIFALSGCSKFRKIQKSGDWKVKYEAALKYYEEQDYYRSGVLLEEIRPIIRGTKEAELAEFYFAYTNFYQGMYLLSAHHFKEFVRTYGRSEYAMEANYQYANSVYMQSPNSSLDQTSTYEAIGALQAFLDKYPASEFSEKADNQISELQIKLEQKAYDNAKLYYKLKRYKAAIVAFDNFLKEYPDSNYALEIGFLSIKTVFDLAEISIQSKQEERYRSTIEKYEKYLDRFPKSPYLKDAENIYAKSTKQLRTFADRKTQENNK